MLLYCCERNAVKGAGGGLEKGKIGKDQRSGTGKENISQKTLFGSFVDGERSRL